MDSVRTSPDREDLTVLASNALEELADNLAADLRAHPPPDLLAEDCIVVPSPGLGRWLQQRLARGLGIVMRTRFLLPGRALAEFATALGCPESAEAAAFHDPERAVWRVFAALEGGTIAGGDALTRWQLAGRVTAAFDRYLVARPGVLRAWDRGEVGDEGVLRWQAGLWREAFAPPSGPPPLVRALARVGGVTDAALLPHRVHVFGVGVLAPLYIEVLRRVASAVPVRVYQLQPTDTYWGDAALRRRGAAADAGAAHPLLQAFGRLARDAQELFAEAQQEDVPFRAPQAATLLAHVQRGLLEHPFEPEGGFARQALDPADRSIRVHACHGPLRELEVVRQEILAFLAAHPDARPADVLVLAPDIEPYAALVPAVFGDPALTPRLPWQVADRGGTATLPGVRALLGLLELAGGRLPASGVVGLLENPSVAAAAGLSPEEVARARAWLREAGLRWGADAAARTDLGLPDDDASTWAAARRALLLGTVLRRDDDTPFARVLPHAGAGADPASAARLVEFVDSLVEHARALREPRPARAWAQAVRRAADALLDPEDAAAAVVAAVLGLLDQADVGAPVPREVVAAWLAQSLDRRGGAAALPGAGVLFCALQPLRAVPARAVFVIGLESGAFPRNPAAPSFDLVARAPLRGDRTPREDDRLLFLETLLSARDQIHFTYVGRSAADNLPLAPSAALEEFLHILERLAEPPAGRDLRALLVVEHRLQAFHPAYFEGSAELLQHDATDAVAASALRGPVAAPAPFVAPERAEAARGAFSPWTTAEPGDVPLEELALLLTHPARYHLRHGLGVLWPVREAQVEDALFSDAPELRRHLLEMWHADCRLRGVEPTLERARALGLAVPGNVGAAQLAEAAASSTALERFLNRALDGRREALEVAAEVAPGVHVRGVLRPLHHTADGACILRYRASDRDRARALRPWLEHLLLCAWGGLKVAEGCVGFRDDKTLVLPSVDPAEARRRLALLAALRERARRAPLPLEPLAAEMVARALARPDGDVARAVEAARTSLARTHGGGTPRLEEPEVALAWRGDDPCGGDFLELVETVWVPVLAGLAEPEDGAET